jgi:aryl-alcohol dehydrogenase-like predicted oxidoreductase
MQLDYIDVLYFHQFDALTPIEESLAAIEDLVRQQAIRYFAVSNFNQEQLESYRKVTEGSFPRTRITAVQNNFDLLNGETANQTGVLSYSAEHGISYVAWSPLARGLLSDRYINPEGVGPGSRLFDEGDLDKALEPAIAQRLQKLAVLSQAWGMELNQLALAYMLTLPGMGPVIPSSSTVKQLEANAAAGRIVLTNEQQAKVREALQF